MKNLLIIIVLMLNSMQAQIKSGVALNGVIVNEGNGYNLSYLTELNLIKKFKLISSIGLGQYKTFNQTNYTNIFNSYNISFGIRYDNFQLRPQMNIELINANLFSSEINSFGGLELCKSKRFLNYQVGLNYNNPKLKSWSFAIFTGVAKGLQSEILNNNGLSKECQQKLRLINKFSIIYIL